MELSFKDKNILITGVGQGIGNCLAKTLSKGGANVYGISKTEANLEALRRECPSVRTFCQDVSKWKELKELVESLPVMDGLVNNAGINILETIVDIKEESLDSVLGVNLKPVINVTQTVARKMMESGRAGSIVNVSSQASLVAIESHASYACSKAAMDQLTRVMALEFGPHKIRANSVNPTVVLTELGKRHWKGDLVEPMLNKIPLRKFADPEDVVNTIMYLLSDKSAMITGAILPVDGGYTAC